MNKKQILVVGAGGHAKVVSEIINFSSNWEVSIYLDEGLEKPTFLNKPVFKSFMDIKQNLPQIKDAFIAIGKNQIRKKWHLFLLENGFNIPSFHHPSAVISPSATIKNGVLIAAQAVLGPYCTVNDGVIINTGAKLDHDTTVDSFSHIRQNAVLCGGAWVGSDTDIDPCGVIERMTRTRGMTVKYEKAHL